ncbi:hypothetical protein J8J14_09575 [Roseomonas sp. SSH11]|uniref:Uncharacterized protein n=1 Tax=Pararoseomonas baculiformis TaxID=2820812 RepID=A0ABS4AFK8_9PROT|nr:hypothetical protein [Pararoseomonas baculiformis]MBP0445029.1 hypothetical protein [Pararoseomonas baculiformis]
MSEDEATENPSYLCHIGHAFSISEMHVQQMHLVDRTLSAAWRALNERAEFCRCVMRDAEANGDRAAVARWTELQHEVKLKAEVMRGLIQRGWADLSTDSEGEP